MNISLNGYGTGYVTLEAAEGLTEGVLAKISANTPPLPPGTRSLIGPGYCRSGTAWPWYSSRASAPWPTPAALPPWAMICSPRTLPAASRPPKPADALSWSPRWIPLP